MGVPEKMQDVAYLQQREMQAFLDELGVPERVQAVAFDPDGEITSQADAKAYGEWLIAERLKRQESKQAKKEDSDG